MNDPARQPAAVRAVQDEGTVGGRRGAVPGRLEVRLGTPGVRLHSLHSVEVVSPLEPRVIACVAGMNVSSATVRGDALVAPGVQGVADDVRLQSLREAQVADSV